VISRRPADFSLCIASLIALGACHPNETGGGGGSTSSSSDVSSTGGGSSSTSGGGGGGGTGGASSSSSGSVGGAGGAASSSSASSSSSSGTGGGAGGVTVAWTQAIPSGGPSSIFVGGISAETPNRLFIGGQLNGDSLTYAGTTVIEAAPHHAGYALSMDGAGNPVSNARFGDTSYNYEARLFATDAAGNVFVAGDGNGINGISFLPVQKLGASPWAQKPGGLSDVGNPSAFGIATDLTGNLLLDVSVPQQGANFGGGQQTSAVILKLDAATGGFVWNKPSPGGSMHRDSAGNLFFLRSSPSIVVEKDDANLAPIWTKSLTGSLAARMAVGPSGEIGIAGTFQGTIDLGCGPLVSTGNADNLAVARLDATGNCLYAKSFAPAGYNAGNLALGITAAGEIVVVNVITSSIDFGGGAVAPGTFVLKLGAAGGHVASTSVAADQLFSAVDAQGAVYLVGHDFDAGTGPILGNVPGIAVAKLVP
jgi:hypothetical protein